MADLKTSAGRGARPDLLDPAALSQLGGIEFIAREVVEGFLMGLHRSPHRGFSAEFAELRAYQAGDDLRYIDWRMYGRSDRYYVKQFEEETNLRAHILVDISESMGWSSEPGVQPSKLWYAKHLAASIALILLRQGDSVGMAAFHDRIVDRRASGRGRETASARARGPAIRPPRLQGGYAHGAQVPASPRARGAGLPCHRPG
jgi:uncharacterized protein (DUF58 family)